MEKLSPVLAYFVCEDDKQGFQYAKAMLELGGLGHSAVIHSDNHDLCVKYGEEMKVGLSLIHISIRKTATSNIRWP